MPLRTTWETVTPPAIEPVGVAELKQFLKVEGDAEDDLLASLIATARIAAEDYTGRALITQTIRLTVTGTGRKDDWFPGYFQVPVNFFDEALPTSVPLPRQPVQSIASVTTYDQYNAATVFDPARYTLIGGALTLNAGAYWPSTLRSVSPAVIDYVAGYGSTPESVPAPIRTAIKMQVRDFYQPIATGGIRVLKAGDGTIEYAESAPGVNATVAALLAPYRTVRLG